MSVQKKEVEYAKEIDDCLLLLVNLSKAIKAKKSPAEIVGAELQDLINAMSGIDQIGEEAKNKMVALQTVLLRGIDIAEVFIG